MRTITVPVGAVSPELKELENLQFLRLNVKVHGQDASGAAAQRSLE